MLPRKLRHVPTSLLLATLILIVTVGLGIRCGGPRTEIQTADLGRFKLVYWPLAEKRVSGSEIEITSGGPRHFEIRAVSTAFEGLNRVKQQQLVYGAITELMAGASPPVHAVDRLECLVP